jgi:Beta-lactamase enzyme family
MRIKDICRFSLILGLLVACHPSRMSTVPASSVQTGDYTGAISARPGTGAGVPRVGGETRTATDGETRSAAARVAGTGSAGLAGTDGAKTDSLLVNLLSRYPQYFSRILAARDSFRVQVIYTQIDRDAENKPSFRNYYFNANSGEYFYPASTVKLPVALLALQKLNELRLPGLDRNSTLVTGDAYSGQTAVYNDPTTEDGRPSIAQYIKKILLVSDNDAFNRLYEFLGQESINARLHKMGYSDAAILHRLDISLSEDENRHTNPVSFYDTTGRLLYDQPPEASSLAYPVRWDSLGNAYYSNGRLIGHPMDFSRKNRISLEDLHQILRSVIFPQSVPAEQRFNLRDEDYPFLYQYLSEYPGEAVYPSYDTTDYWDAFGKFLYWGAQRGSLPRRSIRIFSKEGDAYGSLTDISYFTDPDNGVEFMLSATIYCNSDGVLNDDLYDYDSIGLPFMKNLGRVIYSYELQRQKAHVPDLSGWRMSYR